MAAASPPRRRRLVLDAGASHVIVTSYVFRDGQVDQDRLRRLVRAVGKERLVLDLSCRKKGDDYFVVTDRWQKWTDVKVDAAGMAALASSCDEFLVHGVDVEGMKLGIDEELVRRLGEHSPIPVTYAGARDPAAVGARACAGGSCGGRHRRERARLLRGCLALRRGGRLAQRAEEPRGVR